MRIAVLTSSRADYGIYLPLLKKLNADAFFTLEMIVFGTHLSSKHGQTIDQIEKEGFSVLEKIETQPDGDDPADISRSIGDTISKFSTIWTKHGDSLDVIFGLGDRFEMFAAMTAAIPFNLRLAHIHGGETTLGAIDNIFRHSITLMSSIHFVSTETYKLRVKDMTGSDDHVFDVGAMSLENLDHLKLLDKASFFKEHHVDLSIPTILFTFHPETVNVSHNKRYASVITDVLETMTDMFQVLITMPNVDTKSEVIRTSLLSVIKSNDKIKGVESLGTLGYFSCMKQCAFLMGNTSSGIIEAASMGKYVINLGDRQKGRAQSSNTIDVPIEKQKIIDAVNDLCKGDLNYKGENIYAKVNGSNRVLEILKSLDA